MGVSVGAVFRRRPLVSRQTPGVGAALHRRDPLGDNLRTRFALLSSTPELLLKSMTATPACMNFAAAARPAFRALSPGEAVLSTGTCFPLDASGALLVHSNLVIGVFIGTAAVITACSRGDADARDTREQFVRCLAGTGYEIVRVRLRFPVWSFSSRTSR